LRSKNSGKISAIIWDYDGTLVDSRRKNLNVTRKIISKILKGNPSEIPALSSLNNYHQANIKAANWREFYKESFGLTGEQTDNAGRMWTEFQIKDHTHIPLMDGVEDVIYSLNKYPQGIVSQNSRSNIIRYLKEKNLLSYFKDIVGYEEVKMERQKPFPDGLLLCIEKLTDFKPRVVIYIGDHETDVRCALNANKELTERNTSLKIVAIGALYGYNADTSKWILQPDYYVSKAEDIINIISGLEEQ